ncbi:MAG TPA: hypothetical protein ENG87_05895 [Candidatus Pacearchaeota archaeon]|nr:hypothetical protein [Candidatus Pacearchaeota archaeon]
MNKKDEETIYREFLKYRDLPPDLWPRIAEDKGSSVLKPSLPERRFVRSLPTTVNKANRESPSRLNTGNSMYLTRNLVGRVVSVGTDPVLLIDSPYTHPYMILNPSTSVGLTTTVTGYSGIASNNDVSSSFGVSGFRSVHLTLDVTSIDAATTWDIYAQSYDSISGKWADTQIVFSISSTGTSYAFIDSLGVGTDIRFKFVRTAGTGTLTNSIGCILKNGIGGSSAGLAQSVYIGGPGISTSSGYPILEGQEKIFTIEESVQLWAVANVTINIHIFQL